MSRRKGYKRYLEPSNSNNLYDEPITPKSTLHSRKKRKLQSNTQRSLSNDIIAEPSTSRHESEDLVEPSICCESSAVGSIIETHSQHYDIPSDKDDSILDEHEHSDIHSSNQSYLESDIDNDDWFECSDEYSTCNGSDSTNSTYSDDHNRLSNTDAEQINCGTSTSSSNSKETGNEGLPLFSDGSDVNESSAVDETSGLSHDESNAAAAEDDDDIHSEEHDPYLSETLCPCTNTTRGEVMMMAILLGMEHSLTWVAIISILNLVNSIYERNVVPATKHKLFKYFQHDTDAVQYHNYCSVCNTYAGLRSSLKADVTVCRNCGFLFDEKTMKTHFFLTLNFRSQLEKLLENPEVQNGLNYNRRRRKRISANLEDLHDAKMYTAFSHMNSTRNEEWNLSYTFNTDGCQAANSSKTTIWPIYVMINELPPKLRSKHMLLVGLWINEKEPDMKTFLRPFINEANSLSTEGVEWIRNGETIISRVYPLCYCVDSVARCSMLSMKRFNGIHGCTFCHHPTENVDGFRKYTVSDEVPTERTDETIRTDMITACNSEEPVNGVWGPSPLMNLNNFDLANGMTPDYMHSVLLGVTSQHTDILLTSTNTDYYIGSPNDRAVINQRLFSAKIPKCITRSPRKIEERKMWKASEWRSWLIWYALVCLRGVIQLKYLQHLAFLVTAIEIFLQDSISPQMIEQAEQLLIRYVVLFQEYFGKQAMTYNVHLLLHISKSVRNFGPLWAHNAFAFENENRLLLNMKKSPRHLAVQLARRYLFYKSVPQFCQKFPIGQRFIEFCDDKDQVKFFFRVEETLLIGSGKKHTLSREETQCLGFSGNCLSFKKMISNNIRYTTECYGHSLKTNDSIIITKQGHRGIITNLCKIKLREQETVVVFYREILCEAGPFLAGRHLKVTHIKKCNVDDGQLQHCSPEALMGQCILMNANQEVFIATIPRGCRGD